MPGARIQIDTGGGKLLYNARAFWPQQLPCSPMSLPVNSYQQLLAEGRTSLRLEDIKTYGIQRFLEEQALRGPLQLPKLHFTDEENQLMDQLLAEEQAATPAAATGETVKSEDVA